MLSNCKTIKGTPVVFQPVLINGQGTVTFGRQVQIGVINAPDFYTGYAYIEAREAGASVEFGNNIAINNGFSAVAERSSIRIEDGALIGANCHITDSDFHALAPGARETGAYSCKPVLLKKNVFIGSNVSILKGVTIGENSVIAHGAVVSHDIPPNVMAGGVPARILKTI